jgi:hypothetical protein
VKYSKEAVLARFYKLPQLRFEDQQLTSFGGAIVFQVLFQRLNLKARLKQCFQPLKGSGIFGPHRIVLLLIVHLLLGFRRLREVDYYRDDPLVLRLLGLRRLPDVATICRTLAALSRHNIDKVKQLCSAVVLDALRREGFARLTLDFDGSVTSTRGHAEGSAVGYNTRKKGARSYYNLYCTVAQTGQFLDVLHRPGNVHDSNGAHAFMMANFDRVREAFPDTVLESRLDSAFFSHKTLTLMDLYGVEATVSVPFERFPVLKEMIEARRRWLPLDDERSYFESDWSPDSWAASYRFLFVRRKVRRQIKGPLQLDLFEPRDIDHDYRVVVTNKMGSAHSVLLFHYGRGTQEGIFAEGKQHAGLDLIPTRRLLGNQMVTLCAMMAHNLGREMQMLAQPRARYARAKRPAAWTFQTLDTLRHRFIQRAARITQPKGELTLTLSANPTVKKDLVHFLEALQKAA